MCVPAVTFRSVVKRTPLAETFTVTAANSSMSVERATGKLKGNRTAQRTSCRGGVPVPVCETVNPEVDGFIQQNPLPVAISILYLNIDQNRKTPKFLSPGPNVPCIERFRTCLFRVMPLTHSNHRSIRETRATLKCPIYPRNAERPLPPAPYCLFAIYHLCYSLGESVPQSFRYRQNAAEAPTHSLSRLWSTPIIFPRPRRTSGNTGVSSPPSGHR